MALTNNKLSTNLREKLIQRQEQAKSKGGKDDPRFLNYFDLPFDGQMEVLLLPDGGDSGELFFDYEKHGPGLKMRGVGSVRCCYESSREDCPACARSFEFHDNGDKDNAAKWRRKTSTIAQVVVLKSPIEITQSEDGNPVKLMHLPWALHELIYDSVINELIDDPTEHIMVIKKTQNAGKKASYEKSFFKPKKLDLAADLPPELVKAIEEDKMKPYDLSKEIPAPTTTADVQAWLDKADAKIANSSVSSVASDDSNGQAQAAAPAQTGATAQAEAQQESVSTQTQEVPAAAGLRERLAAARAAAQNG